MKIEFKIDDKYKEIFKDEIKDMERLVKKAGLEKERFGLYTGKGIPENNIAILQLGFLSSQWFRENASSLWIYYDENDEYGEDVLKGYFELEEKLSKISLSFPNLRNRRPQ